MSDASKPAVIRNKQIFNLIILVALVILGFVVLFYLVSNNSKKTIPDEKKTDFANPISQIDAESVILERTQKQLNDSAQKTRKMQEQINSLIQENQDKPLQVSDDLRKRIDLLEKQLQASESKSDLQAPIQKSRNYPASFPFPTVQANPEMPAGQGIREDVLSLSGESEKEKIPLKNPDTYVPPGATARVVMLTGADASAAVTASHNPNPMIFRITSNGRLPNNRKSHLKDCILTAYAVGDISSERAEINLEKLSCTFPNNEIVDINVQGWIFGLDGKYGVRGRPVWREGKLLQRAFVAGALSGLSEGISQTWTTTSISPLGSTQSTNNGKILQVGATKGVSKAMDKLSEYNIQRAEQYHPVIQIDSGEEVDVVFREGFFLDGKKHENHDKGVGNYANSIPSQGTPSFLAENQDETQTLPLSPDAVKRIQEHSRELGLRVSTQTGS